jgi:hypothetical protein
VKITRKQYDKASLVAFETVMVGNEALLTDEALEAFCVALGIEIEEVAPARFRPVEYVWVERTWSDVRQGDVVRPPGMQAHEAIVTGIGPVCAWHADPNSHPRWPTPMEWQARPVAMVPLGKGEESAFTPVNGVNPDAGVEIRVTRGELAAIEALGGWKERVALNESGA